MFQRMMAGLLGTKQQLGWGRVLRREGSAPAGRSKLGRFLQPMLRASVALVAFVAVPVLSAGINDTGITVAQDAYGGQISCSDSTSYPRQDACFGRDAQASAGTLTKTGGGGKGFDFTQIYDSGKPACTQDNVTGLTWEVKTTSSGLHNRNNTYSWYQGGVGVPDSGSCSGGSGCDTTKFVADVNAAGLCGANDWRLPTVKELEGLVDYGINLNSNPSPAATDPTYFADTSIDRAFWTSAMDSATAAYAWATDFLDGSVSRGHPFQAALHVRLVRGTANPSRFVSTSNGTTVTDNSTGLMWKRNYEMLDPANPGTYLNRKDTFLWSDALQRAVTDRTGGYTDWRVPSVKELRSLLDQTRDHPAMDTSFFPATPLGSYFWTSSPTFDYRWNAMVWNVGFDFGQDGIVPPYQTSYVRLVRDSAGTATAAQYALTVTKSGAGTGTVASTAGIGCGSICIANLYDGTSVTLTATPDAGSAFDSWSGACSGQSTCTVSMTLAQSVTANFVISTNPVYTLSVTNTSTGGSGVVTGSGINCGGTATTCSQVYSSSTSVTLTATPATGSAFGGWSGGCSGQGTCTVTMNQAQNVNATFISGTGSGVSYLLSVTYSGTGTGRVGSSPAGIDCVSSCSSNFSAGTSVSLSYTEDAGSTFTGWSGACSGMSFCTVSMTQAQNVSANFNASGYTLSITKLGTGSGTVVSSPAAINCASQCNTQSTQFASGTSVTLTATADSGSTFGGWSGGGCSGQGTCTVNLNQAQNVSATFNSSTGTGISYTLSVTKSSTGSGTVVSSPTGIDCGTQCSTTSGTSVTLSATANVGSTFTGWSGSGCSGTGFCTVSMNQAQNVTAAFASSGYTLSVTALGTGSGTVVSSPAGINCATSCNLQFASGTSVTLSATADAGSTFTGWTGAGCSGKGTCTVNMNQAQSVIATFSSGSAASYTLSVTKSGTGSGTVISSPAGISCGTACSMGYPSGTSVTLGATANAGSTFTGWSGAGCSGTFLCTVSMNQAQNVSATFTSGSGSGSGSGSSYTLSVTKSGTGSGTVVSSPAGINCATSCNTQFASGTSVTLSATADAGSTFTGWTGAGCSGKGTCTVNMNQAQNVSANFTSGSVASYTLSVTRSGTGSGTVVSSPAGINCGTACSMIYPSGTSVTLGAIANAGSTFTGWSGGGCSGTFLCTVSMNQAQNVTATFFSSSGYTLSVTKSGTGSGAVTNSTINCGTVCSAGYPGGTSVTLTATADSGSTFSGWSGACSGMGTCTVSMNQAQSVTATFALVSVSSASLYDGIYQWDTGYYLSVHQIGGGAVKASIYWVYTANTEQVGTRAIPAADTFDLLQGQIVGSKATISGTRFYRACTLSYDLTFNADSSLTVRLNSVSNSLGVSVADVDCAARYQSVGSVWTIPRIF